MQKEDITRIANLARIELTPEEAETFALEVTSVLGYVSEIKEITGDAPEEKVIGALYNVMREDTNPHEEGYFTEALLASAPERDGQYVKVKKILDQDT
jgi:aspartyl-tRNA(Asn)/glutamyl-tRNA(Gln) amidotransferase subunit C